MPSNATADILEYINVSKVNSTKKITIAVLIFLTLLLAGVSIFVAIDLNNRNNDVGVTTTTGVSCNVQGGPSNWNVSCSGNLAQSYKIVGYQCAQQGLSYCVPSNGGVPVTVSASVAIEGNPTPSSFTASMSQFPLGNCGTVQLDTLARSLDINNAGDITGGKVANLGSGNCAGGGTTTPNPTGITVGGRVVCKDPNADAIQLQGVRIKITHSRDDIDTDEPRVEYVTTDAQGAFVKEYPNVSNRRQFRIEVESLPSGAMPNGQLYSELTSLTAAYCNNKPALSTCVKTGNTSDRNFCGGGSGNSDSFYRQCDLSPGQQEKNFRFEYTNCAPVVVPKCGDTCSTNTQCPTDHACQSNKCVLNTCATDPSKCTADKCTLLPDAQCGGSCTTNAQCPNNHTCQSNKCVLNMCATDPTKCAADKCTMLAVCGGSCTSNSQCPNDHTCSNNRCIINQCVNNANCTNNGCTLPATALFDDQTDIILVGLLLVFAGLTVYKLNWHQVFYSVISKSDSAKLLLLDKDNALRKETEERLEMKERNKKKVERMKKREGFERRFGE